MDQIAHTYRVDALTNRKRLLPYHLPLSTLGFLPRKRQWVGGELEGIAFSLILEGRGLLKQGEQVWNIQAPCMFTPAAVPGCTYGPDRTWHEVFIVYEAHLLDVFKKLNYVRPDQPVWRMPETTSLLPLLHELWDLTHHVDAPGTTDRMDMLAEALLRESLLSAWQARPGTENALLSAARSGVERHYLRDPDVEVLARQCAMSESAFRRAWRRHFGGAPKQYALSLRIQEACRLLVATDQRINEIARRTGFDDPLYFSRAFHKRMAMSPSAYRRNFS